MTNLWIVYYVNYNYSKKDEDVIIIIGMYRSERLARLESTLFEKGIKNGRCGYYEFDGRINEHCD